MCTKPIFKTSRLLFIQYKINKSKSTQRKNESCLLMVTLSRCMIFAFSLSVKLPKIIFRVRAVSQNDECQNLNEAVAIRANKKNAIFIISV